MTPTVKLFGLDFSALTFKEATDALSDAAARNDDSPRIVVTPNVDHVVRLESSPDFKARYAQADFIFADGMPVVWTSRLVGRPLPERVTGADLFLALCRRAQAEGWQVAVLGGDARIEEEIRQGFARSFPGLRVEILIPSTQYDPEGQEAQEHARRIRELTPRMVFVCLGMPKQEKWAFRYAPVLKGGIILCAGMAMMFAIGMQSRAPLWMQRSGLEWLWRMGSEPRRMVRRYLVEDVKFLGLFWREWRGR